MFLIWRRFVRWLRNLGLKFARKQPVDWPTEINDLLAIVNSALDKEGVPKVSTNPTPTNSAAEPTSEPIPNTPKPATPPAPMTDMSSTPAKQRRFQGRLMAFLRRRNSENKATDTTPNK